MANRGTRDNLLAGAFVIGGTILAVWASFMLGERAVIGGVNRVVVRFPVSVGAHGLKPGAMVALGGQKIGSVSSVVFHPQDLTPTAVDVSIEVPHSLKLMNNAIFTLERPLLGSLSSINITSSGGGDDIRELADGAVVTGMLAPPALLSQTGFTPADVQNLRSSIQKMDQSLTRISQLIETRTPDVDRSLSDVQQMVEGLKRNFSAWSASVTATLEQAEAASAKFSPMVDRADAVVSDAKAFVDRLQAVVDENRAHVSSAIASIDSVAGKIDRQLAGEINGAMGKAKEALESIDKTVRQVSAVVASETPNLQRMMANLRLTADNLKLTSIEVRSQPWRLLHQPTTKELSTQAMYDATRAYAEASSDLRAASESLRTLLAAQDAKTTTPGAVDEASKVLSQAAEKYKAAERRLMDVLMREEK